MSLAQLRAFIEEAKRRGYATDEIQRVLMNAGWSQEEVDHAFEHLAEKKSKNQISIYLDDLVLAAIEKRAKRNMLSPAEQIEDIVRRSAVNAKHTSAKPEKLDDLLVSVFSRKRKK